MQPLYQFIFFFFKISHSLLYFHSLIIFLQNAIDESISLLHFLIASFLKNSIKVSIGPIIRHPLIHLPSLCDLRLPSSISVSSLWHSNSSFTPILFASESSSHSSTFRLSISVPQKFVSFTYVDSILKLLFCFILWRENFNITAPPPLAPAFSWCRLSGRGPPRFVIWPAWPAPLCALSPVSFSTPSSLPSWEGRSCWPAAWRRRQPSSCSHGFLWAHRWLLQLNLHTCIVHFHIIALASSALSTFIIILLLEDVLQPMEPFLVFQVIQLVRCCPFYCCYKFKKR